MAQTRKGTDSVGLIVADIDGCLSRGKRWPFDLRSLGILRRYTETAISLGMPPLTLCTGRPQPYVEAMAQILGVHKTCICENGALLYNPVEDVTLVNPAIDDEIKRDIQEIRAILSDKSRLNTNIQFEPGKEICISINPVQVVSEQPLSTATPTADAVAELCETIRGIVDVSRFTVTHSASAVDITPLGIDKGQGLRWLSKVEATAVEHILGIGDSSGDLPFLKMSGASAAPGNASQAIKDAVTFVAPRPYAEGVLDILSHFLGLEPPETNGPAGV